MAPYIDKYTIYQRNVWTYDTTYDKLLSPLPPCLPVCILLCHCSAPAAVWQRKQRGPLSVTPRIPGPSLHATSPPGVPRSEDDAETDLSHAEGDEAGQAQRGCCCCHFCCHCQVRSHSAAVTWSLLATSGAVICTDTFSFTSWCRYCHIVLSAFTQTICVYCSVLSFTTDLPSSCVGLFIETKQRGNSHASSPVRQYAGTAVLWAKCYLQYANYILMFLSAWHFSSLTFAY